MRNKFDEQLFELNRELIEMGSMCEEAIASVANALANGDVDLAKRIKQDGSGIDHMERNIEITDMERIGDMAEDIAEIVGFLNGHTMDGMEMVLEMAMETSKMVNASVDAFVKKDIELAKAVLVQDDIVDDYFSRIKSGIITLIAGNANDGEFALDLLMISKYFERIGDHATNIAEWVIYSVTGTH